MDQRLMARWRGTPGAVSISVVMAAKHDLSAALNPMGLEIYSEPIVYWEKTTPVLIFPIREGAFPSDG